MFCQRRAYDLVRFRKRWCFCGGTEMPNTTTNQKTQQSATIHVAWGNLPRLVWLMLLCFFGFVVVVSVLLPWFALQGHRMFLHNTTNTAGESSSIFVRNVKLWFFGSVFHAVNFFFFFFLGTEKSFSLRLRSQTYLWTQCVQRSLPSRLSTHSVQTLCTWKISWCIPRWQELGPECIAAVQAGCEAVQAQLFILTLTSLLRIFYMTKWRFMGSFFVCENWC